MTANRKLTITACTVVKSGTTNGRNWTLFNVQALNEHGFDVSEDLISFDPLPVGELLEFEIKRKEKVGQYKTFVSYTLSLPKKSNRLDSPKEQIPLVPRGRYAVRVGDDIVFVRVWRGTQNPFAQRMYLLLRAELSTLDPRSLRGVV
jgi:hypothetical protein